MTWTFLQWFSIVFFVGGAMAGWLVWFLMLLDVVRGWRRNAQKRREETLRFKAEHARRMREAMDPMSPRPFPSEPFVKG